VKPLALALIACALLVPTAGQAELRHPTERYDPHKAGHPLRIAGYAGHAVGMLVDLVLFRPAWYIGHFEPLYTLTGRYHNRVAVRSEAEEVEMGIERKGWDEPEAPDQLP
jgi:hypothetical protein